MSTPLRRVLFLFVTALFSLTPLARAQDRWTIQVHGGAAIAPDPGAGSVTLPTPGATVTTIPGRPTRPVPSWFFGDGVTLMNEVNAQVRPTLVTTGLDALLGRPGLRAGTSAAFGVRVTRTLTPRVSIEGAVSLQGSSLSLDDSVRRSVEDSFESFRAFWQTAAGTNIAETDARYDEQSGRQLTSTAGLRLHLAGSGGRSLYALAGGGLRSTFGQRATAILEGRYNLRIGDTQQWAERDNVTLSFEVDDHVPVGLVGVGWEQPVSPWAGFSFEVRSHVGPSGVSTRVTTAPERNVRSSGGAVAILGSAPSMYLSSTSAADSSLTTDLHEFRTSRDGGLRANTTITGGLFFRF
jgi:hypothetical protein